MVIIHKIDLNFIVYFVYLDTYLHNQIKELGALESFFSASELKFFKKTSI